MLKPTWLARGAWTAGICLILWKAAAWPFQTIRHTAPYPGDHGLRFEPAAGLKG